ncbi:peptide-methionine (S)-S-oxide reductase MsrA [Patescibacteria group bacterium]|nr:peptide-methionine (S)-S-oxide reductase MsrA [Patescibacteria group bacterium]
MKTETAYFAGGCFWGVEYYMQKQEGVVSCKVGYMGGETKNPSYEEVCTGTTGHAETVEIKFNPDTISFEELAKLFFEIHDPTQLNRQGPDIGDQYRSEIIYTNEAQKKTAEKLINKLKIKGYEVVTKISQAGDFWEADEHHQDYYKKNGEIPYCHSRTKKF